MVEYTKNTSLWALPTRVLRAPPDFDEYGKFAETNGLEVSYVGLIKLGPSVSALTKLRTLHISDNALTELPAVLSGLTSLTELDVSNNQLTTLANVPSSLIVLSANLNELCELQSLDTLPRLEFLAVSGNNITVIPDITGAQRLGVLDLSHNPIAGCHFRSIGHCLAMPAYRRASPIYNGDPNDAFDLLLRWNIPRDIVGLVNDYVTIVAVSK